MNLEAYWNACLNQEAQEMKIYFNDDAYVRWYNTNEQFTVHEFIRANCEYPGKWKGQIERMETIDSGFITIVRVWDEDDKCSFHVTSFFQIVNEKIQAIEEYWGEDGVAPQWRLDKHISNPIFEH